MSLSTNVVDTMLNAVFVWQRDTRSHKLSPRFQPPVSEHPHQVRNESSQCEPLQLSPLCRQQRHSKHDDCTHFSEEALRWRKDGATSFTTTQVTKHACTPSPATRPIATSAPSSNPLAVSPPKKITRLHRPLHEAGCPRRAGEGEPIITRAVRLHVPQVRDRATLLRVRVPYFS